MCGLHAASSNNMIEIKRKRNRRRSGGWPASFIVGRLHLCSSSSLLSSARVRHRGSFLLWMWLRGRWQGLGMPAWAASSVVGGQGAGVLAGDGVLTRALSLSHHGHWVGTSAAFTVFTPPSLDEGRSEGRGVGYPHSHSRLSWRVILVIFRGFRCPFVFVFVSAGRQRGQDRGAGLRADR